MNTEQAAEMMRLIYVALTRAIHRLISGGGLLYVPQ